MKTSYAATLVLALATLTAGQAMAGEYVAENYLPAPVTAGKTRDQVRVELAQAQRGGDMIANFETGLKVSEVSPANYPSQVVAQSTTRQQVRAEVVQALRHGDLTSSFELGPKFN